MKGLNTHIGQIKVSWSKVFWLYTILALTLFIDFSLITLSDIIINILLLFLTVGLGHSVGLHRGLIHKSYKTSNTFQKVSLYLFVLTGLGSPKDWLKQHYYRDYWQNRTDCPRYYQYQHSLFTDFFWNLHLTFIPVNNKRYNIPEKDLNNNYLNWLSKTWSIHYGLFAFILYLLLGINSMLIATSLRTAIIILGHWYIGYASHKYGYARHKIKGADESGYNDVLLGFISFGEGFHNNHHSYPSSAKFSSKWYEIDFGWSLIWLLKKMNIIHNVNTQNGTLKNTAINYPRTKWKFPFY